MLNLLLQIANSHVHAFQVFVNKQRLETFDQKTSNAKSVADIRLDVYHHTLQPVKSDF